MADMIRTRREQCWMELTIHRPDARNAMNREMTEALLAAVQEAACCDDCRAVILTGSGERAFSAGADIPEMCAMEGSEVADFTNLGQQVTFALEACPQPVVAAVNGFALGGGCELALACDLIFASDTAQLGLPEVNLGIIPGWGGTQRLPRRVGIGRAREIIYTGRRVGAEEALRIGFVDRIVPHDMLMHEVRAFATQLGSLSQPALAAAKEALRNAVTLSIAEGCQREAELFAVAFESEGRVEAMGKFGQK